MFFRENQFLAIELKMFNGPKGLLNILFYVEKE